jgi:hypothetical protein
MVTRRPNQVSTNARHGSGATAYAASAAGDRATSTTTSWPRRARPSASVCAARSMPPRLCARCRQPVAQDRETKARQRRHASVTRQRGQRLLGRRRMRGQRLLQAAASPLRIADDAGRRARAPAHARARLASRSAAQRVG